jgi:hypothetical protein
MVIASPSLFVILGEALPVGSGSDRACLPVGRGGTDREEFLMPSLGVKSVR